MKYETELIDDISNMVRVGHLSEKERRDLLYDCVSKDIRTSLSLPKSPYRVYGTFLKVNEEVTEGDVYKSDGGVYYVVVRIGKDSLAYCKEIIFGL